MVRSVRKCNDCHGRFVANADKAICSKCTLDSSTNNTTSVELKVLDSKFSSSSVHEENDNDDDCMLDGVIEGGDDFYCTHGTNNEHDSALQEDTLQDTFPSDRHGVIETHKKEGCTDTEEQNDVSNIMNLASLVEKSLDAQSISTSSAITLNTRSDSSQRVNSIPNTITPASGNARGNTNDNDICFICGSSLIGLKRRIDHIKRCSKKHAISGRDVRLQEEVTHYDESTRQLSTNVNYSTATTTNKNPYNRPSNWHGDAQKLLDLSNHTKSSIETSATITSEQQLQTKQTSLTKYITMPVRNLNNVLMTASRKLSKQEGVILDAQKKRNNNGNEDYENSYGNKRQKFGGRGGTNRNGRWTTQRDYSKIECPKYKKIPGTDFVVDGFHYAKETLTRNYFLTHFHADHYGGINSSWHAGTIYCSLPTANLVNQQLGVDKTYLHPLPMMTPTIIESRGKVITVTLLDANHCPGAIMFFFEIGKRKILHVGDFRWSRDAMLLPSSPLRQIASREMELNDIYLDTTYCDPKYTLPTQGESIQAVIQIFEKEMTRCIGNPCKRTLHLFGAYTIGKERLYLSVAENFGMKVYVDPARFRVLSSLEWPKDRMKLLTPSKSDSCIWVVPLGHINMKKMSAYFELANTKPFAPAYDRIVGYRPTGWSLGTKPSSGIVSSRYSGNLAIHSVPYSEHSSFPELIDCLACLRPGNIIPTVAASKSNEQISTLLSGLRSKQTTLRLGGNEYE